MLGFRILIISAVISGATAALADAPPAAWTRHYNGPASFDDTVNFMALGPGGTVTVTGVSDAPNLREDIATIRYDANGNVLWSARYNSAIDWYDVPAGVGVDAAGAAYVLGNVWGGLNHEGGTEWDYLLIKYNPDGSEAWTRQHDGPIHWSETPVGIVVDAAGNAYVGGYSYKELTPLGQLRPHMHVAKFNTLGSFEWEVFYDLNPHRGALVDDISLAPDGSIVVTGEAAVPSGGTTQDDVITLKITPDGQIQWARHWDSAGPYNEWDDAKRVRTDRFGNVYVLGQYMSEILEEHLNGVLIRYQPNGTLQWVVNMDFTRPDGFFDLIDDADGNLYLSGGVDNGSDLDALVISYSPNGQERWHQIYGGPGYQFANVMMRGPDGLLHVGLDYQWFDAAGYDYTIAVMDNSGSQIDLWRYDTGSTSDTFPWVDGYVMDMAGNIFVGGYSWFDTTRADFTIMKIATQSSASDGDIDGDGDVDFADRDLFVAVLLGAVGDPQLVERCDVNGDGLTDGKDIGSFTAALLGG